MYGENAKKRQWITTLRCSVGMAMAGVTFTWMTPLLKLYGSAVSPIRMTVDEITWLSSIIEIGEIVSTIPAGHCADKWGRQRTIFLTGPICLLSWFMILSSRSLWILFIARFLQGVVIAVIFTVIPTYLVEISEPHRRARIVSTTQIFWHFGILWAYIFGPIFNYYNYLLMCTLMAVIFVPLFYNLPESPYYLIMKNKVKEAYESLLFLRGDEVIEEEFVTLQCTVRQEMSNHTDWTYLFTEKEVRRALIIVLVVCLIRYLNGLSAIMIYVTQLFNLSETNIRPDTMTIVLGCILVVASTIGTFIAESLGRRPLLIISGIGCTFLNAIIFIYLYIDISTRYHVSKYIWILYISVIGLCFVTVLGLGSLMLTIQAEYFQANTRSLSGGIIEMVSGFGAFINIIAFEYISEYFRVYWNFFFYTLLSLLGVMFFYYYLPETAGSNLGRFDQLPNITYQQSRSYKSKNQYLPFEESSINLTSFNLKTLK